MARRKTEDTTDGVENASSTETMDGAENASNTETMDGAETPPVQESRASRNARRALAEFESIELKPGQIAIRTATGGPLLRAGVRWGGEPKVMEPGQLSAEQLREVESEFQLQVRKG